MNDEISSGVSSRTSPVINAPVRPSVYPDAPGLVATGWRNWTGNAGEQAFAGSWLTVCTTPDMILTTTSLAALLLTALPVQDARPLDLADNVDLSRYAGTWYEIARLPNEFQDECASDVTATYTPQSDGDITVVNRCREADGSWNEAEGVARRAGDGEGNAALEVRFAPAILSALPNVWGDYRIIGLDDGSRWAVVGEPEREYLWILSRTPDMPPEDYDRAVAIAQANGFDVAKLRKTRHSR